MTESTYALRVGASLRERRRLLGLTQAEVAELAGTTQRSVSLADSSWRRGTCATSPASPGSPCTTRGGGRGDVEQRVTAAALRPVPCSDGWERREPMDGSVE